MRRCDECGNRKPSSAFKGSATVCRRCAGADRPRYPVRKLPTPPSPLREIFRAEDIVLQALREAARP